MTTRRQFLSHTGLLGAALGVAPQALLGAVRPAPRVALRLLVLGGSGFIGPHLVREAVRRGHRVTIFTRGQTEVELPAGVERLVGDRAGQLGALEGRQWDAVVDNSATNPEWVAATTKLLRPAVGRYLFTSSTGVYYPYLTRGADESTAVRMEFTDPEDGSEQYGVQKAQCEALVRSAFGAQGLVIRPTYIVGPGDTGNRFAYWPQRLRRGGPTLAPGRKNDPVQFIDVRDLVQFMVASLEAERSGIYNVAGPATPLTMSGFLAQAAQALNSSSEFVWVEDYDLLEANEVFGAVPWVMLRGNDYGHMSNSNAKALAAGLTMRPLAQTVRDTLAWWDTVPEARRADPGFSISAESEAALLAAANPSR